MLECVVKPVAPNGAQAADRRLAALRERVAASKVPARSHDKLRIATWNIRELGRRQRRPESLVYIAEILSQFDLVSIVELRENLTELDAIRALLGPTWRALFTGPVFDPAGNRERSTYLFDSRHLPASAGAFTGKGGEVDFYTGGIRALYPASVDEREFTYELSDHLPLWVQITTRKKG